MNHPALKGKVSDKQNKMLKQINPRLSTSKVVSYNQLDFTCLTELNFEDGNSSQNLKVWVSSPWM